MQKIIIYLEASNLSTVSWIALHDDQKAPDVHWHEPLENLRALVKTQLQDVIVIATPMDVLLTQVQLPKLNRSRLALALPFALEEQVLSEVSDLHFVAGNFHVDHFPVAIITKEKMTAWMNAFKELDLTPSAMIPAIYALPVTEHTWHIKIINDTAMVRTSQDQGFSCDKHNLNALLNLHLAQMLLPPVLLQIDNYTLDDIELTTIIAVQKNDFSTKQFMLELAHITLPVPVNLVQAPYQARRKTTSSKKLWLSAAYVAAGWLALILLGNIISFTILQHQNHQLQTAINKIYQQQFPHATDGNASKQRMAEKLSQLTNQAHSNHLLLWLAELGNSLATVPTLKIQQLEFNDNKLVLDIAASKVDNIDVFTQALTQQGLNVKQQNIITDSAQATGTLLISEAGST